jgi:MFS family permease
MFQFQQYQVIFRLPAFRLFWVGFTFSALGDVATRVALTWYVFELTHSPEALGLLSLTYTGPVIISGLFVGSILDRFDRRKVMILDNLVRGTIVFLIPLFHALNILELWHIYLVSLVYGSLVMISLAGSPSLVPDLVDEEHLSTANALETLSYTLSSVIGPLLAGILIPLISAPNVVILDGLSYLLFAGLLLCMNIHKSKVLSHSDDAVATSQYHVADAGRLLLHNPILLSTTLMFMGFNLGFGALMVWLPILSTDVLQGGSELYGGLLGAIAIGELISSLLVGMVQLRPALGKLIAFAQLASGLTILLLLTQLSIVVTFISFFFLGMFSAPLTIWAQTLRMKIIPAELRGRTFALLRMLMQSTNPAGGILAGFLLPILGILTMIGASAAFIAIPGFLGLQVKSLRNAS